MNGWVIEVYIKGEVRKNDLKIYTSSYLMSKCYLLIDPIPFFLIL